MNKCLKFLLIGIGVIILIFLLFVAGVIIIYKTRFTNIDGKFICKNDKVRLGTECIHKIGRLNELAKNLKYGFGDPDRFFAASKLCNETDKCIQSSGCYNTYLDFSAMCITMHYSIGELNGCFKKLDDRFNKDHVPCLEQLFDGNLTDGDCAELQMAELCIDEEVVMNCGKEALPAFKKFDKATKDNCGFE